MLQQSIVPMDPLSQTFFYMIDMTIVVYFADPLSCLAELLPVIPISHRPIQLDKTVLSRLASSRAV